MPIPDFDRILNVLPPHLDDPSNGGSISPYQCTIQEVVERFGGTPERRSILAGFLRFRLELLSNGFQAFQWLDGSFTEDKEAQLREPPNDIDVVTFVGSDISYEELHKLFSKVNPILMVRAYVKERYKVDHFWVPLSFSPTFGPKHLVSQVSYWFGLFSHRRDGVHKGMLEVSMTDLAEDQAALDYLTSQQ